MRNQPNDVCQQNVMIPRKAACGQAGKKRLFMVDGETARVVAG
jgi:hypothetical protein